MQVAFVGGSETMDRIYGQERRTRLPDVDLIAQDIQQDNLQELAPSLGGVEAIFSSWGMLSLDADTIARVFPSLRVIFYGAGTIKGFAAPFFERGVRISSAWRINGLAVAEFTLAHLLLAGKGYLRSARLCSAARANRDEAYRAVAGGNYKTTVALLGAGAIGRRVLEMIQRETTLNVLLYDPFLSEEQAAALGARKATLQECFTQAQVVSNHVPNLPETKHLIRGDHIRMLPHNGTFLNTGRGAQVDEAGLIAALRDRPDLTAILDVTDPEPPAEDSPFYGMPNVFLTPHIAGTMQSEWRQMGDYMLEEFARWRADDRLEAEITPDMLARMA